MRTLLLVTLLLLFAVPQATARDLFRTRVTVGASSVTMGVNSVLDVPDLLDESALIEDFGGAFVPGVSGVAAVLDLRGVQAQGGYAESSPILRFLVPSAGIDVTFDGADRNESNQQLEDWLQGKRVFAGAPEGDLQDLLHALVEFSPVDPVAGNPNSLQSRMFESDLALATLSPFLADFPDAEEKIPNAVRLDFDFGYYAAGPYHGQTYDLALGIGWNVSRRVAIVTDLQLMFGQAEGDALSGFGNIGLGVVGRVKDWWNLSVVAHGGLVGSVDIGALAAMYSVSIINHMQCALGEARLEMSNMVGVSNTVPGFSIQGYDLDYDLTNVVLKNRLAVQQLLPMKLRSRSLRATLYLTDTQYFVDDLWLEHTDEIGVGVGLASERGGSVYDPATLNLAYVVGSGYDALKLSLDLRF